MSCEYRPFRALATNSRSGQYSSSFSARFPLKKIAKPVGGRLTCLKTRPTKWTKERPKAVSPFRKTGKNSNREQHSVGAFLKSSLLRDALEAPRSDRVHLAAISLSKVFRCARRPMFRTWYSPRVLTNRSSSAAGIIALLPKDALTRKLPV